MKLSLEHPLFQSTPFKIPLKDLEEAGDTYPLQPVKLQAAWGPFSYWQFDAAFLLATIVLGGYIVVIRLPRQRAVRLQERRVAELANQVASRSSANITADGAELPPMLGKHLQGASGEEFVVLGMLGHGGMGAVFEAASARPDRPSDERFAVKFVFADMLGQEMALRRFEREVQVLCRLNDARIVKVVDWGRHPLPDGKELPFMVMEKVSGGTLRSLLEKQPGPSLTLPQVMAWTREILQALSVAHGAGVLHRDIKPDNIMLTDRGHVKLMDFGLARDVDRSRLTGSSDAMGTPAYMSPEHLQAHNASVASDVYSVGVMLYEMLSGRLPQDAPNADMWTILTKRISEDPTPLDSLRPDLPSALVGVVMKMIERDLEKRYDTADAVLDDLARIPADSPRT